MPLDYCGKIVPAPLALPRWGRGGVEIDVEDKDQQRLSTYSGACVGLSGIIGVSLKYYKLFTTCLYMTTMLYMFIPGFS